MRINEMRSITVFVKTAQLGSLRRAAEAQSMTPQAASQALAQLEHHLGVRLFYRTTRNMTLTDEGRQFLQAASPALASLQRALEITRRAKDEIAGPLRIVGPRTVFTPLLWPLLDEFCSLYPEVLPDVHLDDRVGNWVEDRVDVGFRIGPSPDEGVIARKLFPLQLIICAAPQYLVRHGAPAAPYQLAAHRCSAFRSTMSGRVLPWQLKVDDTVMDQEVMPSICFSEESLEVQAVLSGHTVAQLTAVAVAPHIRAGRLVPLLTQYVTDRESAYLYYGTRVAQPLRVRAFIDLAVKNLVGNTALVLEPQELAAAEAAGLAAAQAQRPPLGRPGQGMR